MNKVYVRSGLNVVKSTLKVALIFMILGISITAYAGSQVDLAGNYYEIGANQSQERYLGYFNLGEDVQIGLGASFVEDNEGYDDLTDNLMSIVLLHSVSRDFSNVNTVYDVVTSDLYRDFSADEGYYKLVVTNLTNEKLSYVVIEAHSSTSTLAVLALGLVLIGISFAIIGMTIAIIFYTLVILGIIYIVKSVVENEQRKRNSRVTMKNTNTPQNTGSIIS